MNRVPVFDEISFSFSFSLLFFFSKGKGVFFESSFVNSGCSMGIAQENWREISQWAIFFVCVCFGQSWLDVWMSGCLDVWMSGCLDGDAGRRGNVTRRD